MNDKSHAATSQERQLPECFHTAAGETIEITETDFGQYCVDCWDANGEGRWNKKFDKRSDAFVEFERWRYLQTPLTATPSEPKPELSAGMPSSLAETVGERLKRIYPEHYVTIITEMNRVDGPERTARLLGRQAVDGQLRRCFVWERSQQGYDFWANLAKREGS